MARTGAQLLTGLSRFLGDEFSVTGLSTSSAGAAGGTTVVDTELSAYGDDFFRDFWVRITQSGGDQYAFRRVTSFTSSSGTLTVDPAFAGQVGSGDTYELHRFKPDSMFSALDEARLRVYPDVSQIVFDDSITGDGLTRAHDIPTSIRRGPAIAVIEEPAPVNVNWNFVTDPLGDSTTNWTASSVTAATYSRTSEDLLVPKYDSDATKITVAASTAGTYRQAVGSMANNITAAKAAGRHMTFAMWVYARLANKIAVEIVDDNGQVNASSQHAGAGWELLIAEGDISAANATTLTVGLTVDNDANATDFYWNRAWFYHGEPDRIRNIYDETQPHRVRRDDTTGRIYFDIAPPRGRQVRLIGRDILSALGTTASTQVTNTMEVDEANEQVLLAETARLLFLREGLSTNDFPSIARRIALADEEQRQLATRWRTYLPATSPIRGPWVA